MKKQEYLDIVTKQVRYIFDRESIEAEIKEHLEDSIQDLMEDGLSYEEAEEQAVLQMGDPIETGKLLNKEHHPLIGYLYAISMVCVVVVGFNFVITAGIMMWGLIEGVTPGVEENSIATYPIHLEVEMPTHKVKVDNICKIDEGSYSITSRAWRKFSYSRAGWTIDAFKIYNRAGDWIEVGGSKSVSGITQNMSQEFKWPDDDIIVLEFRDGQKYQIDLKEYVYE